MSALSEQTRSQPSAGRRRRLPALAVATGMVTLATAGILLAANLLGPRGEADAAELHLPDTGGAFASCLPFTVEHLATMPAAFAGTATAVAGDRVVLSVDHWYVGGSAAEVTLAMPEGAHGALIGDIDFREGRQYLITAENGTVGLCGFSGESTPAMRAAFDAAF